MSEVQVNIQNPGLNVQITQPEIFIEVKEETASIEIGDPQNVQINIQEPVISVNIFGCGAGTTGGQSADSITITAGEALYSGALLYIAADGLAYLADASDAEKEAFLFCLSDIAQGQSGTAYLSGTITGLAGMTSGERRFLSNSVPGGTSSSIPDSGIVQQVGKATSATRMKFHPQLSILIAGGVAPGDYRITEDGQSRITEGGDFRILEAEQIGDYRITEDGNTRITESGDTRVTE